MSIRPLWALAPIVALAVAGCSQPGATGAGGATNNAAGAAPSAGAPPASGGAFAFGSDPCKVVMTASLAVLQHDHASEMTLPTAPGAATRQAMSVQVSGKTYLQVEGVWRLSTITVADEAQLVNDEAKTAQITCKPSGNDIVDGQPVAIYDAHIVNEGTTSDSRLWISTASGLPLKTETHLDGGEVSTQHIRYDNVTVPANVQTAP